MAITGKDEISLRVVNALQNGIKLKDISYQFPVSTDQAKRLSRYSNMLKKANLYLAGSSIRKLNELGLKSLYLSSLFKNEDWEGLNEILSVINDQTKRDEIPLLIEALHEKRQRLIETEQIVSSKYQQLEDRENHINKLEESINQTIKDIQEKHEFLKKYPPEAQDFLLSHLGLFENQLVLAKRIDSGWRKSLQKKGVLEYIEVQFIWIIKNLDEFVGDYLKRSNRKSPLPTEWNYQKENKRNPYAPTESSYRLPTGLSKDLQTSLYQLEKEREQIRLEKMTIQQELKKLRKTSPQSFIESVEVANQLSLKELKDHGELQNLALKWLFSKEYVAASEIILPNGKRADVMGYDQNGRIIIIEVKVSKKDFIQDQKWKTYLQFADEYYFLLGPNIPVSSLEEANIGLLKRNKNTIEIKRPSSIENQVEDRYKLIWAINRMLSKKYIFGY